MSYAETVSAYHDELAKAVQPLRGRVVTPMEIRVVLVAMFPRREDVVDWVQPSDHCRNHRNKGACRCATTDDALFKRVTRGHYRVL